MTLRFPLPKLQLLSAFIAASVALCTPQAAFSQAQAPAVPGTDSVFLKPRSATERAQQMANVLIVGVNGTKIVIRNAQGDISYDLSQVMEVRKNPPQDFQQAQTLIEAGQLDKALPFLQAITTRYKGLPTPWAADASAMLGNVLISLGKFAEAEAAFGEFEKNYPAAGAGPSSIGKARLAVERGKLDEARAVAEPVVADALTKKNVSRADSKLYGQAYFILGKIAEGEGKLPEAMENYSRTVAIFYQERAVVKEAQKRIDELRQKGITTP
jgi:tetratricopeptide (TPR) repeat protein